MALPASNVSLAELQSAAIAAAEAAKSQKKMDGGGGFAGSGPAFGVGGSGYSSGPGGAAGLPRGMLQTAQLHGTAPAQQPSYGYRPGDNKAFTQDNYTQEDMLNALKALEDMGYGINMDLLGENINDVMGQITEVLSGDYMPPWLSGEGVSSGEEDGFGDGLLVDKDWASRPDGGFVLDAETIASIIPGTIDVRTKLGDAINNGLIDPSTIPPEFFEQIQNQYPGDATIGDVLRDFGLLEDAPEGDLDGDGDLEQGGALFDPPAPRSPTGEWQWNPEMQDYEWVEGTQEATVLDEGSWTDEIKNAAGSITDKIADYILSQKPPSVNPEDWMKTILPNPSISVVQGGPDNTNIWIKLPGPLGDGLIDIEAIKNGEFTLDDAIRGKIDDAVEVISGIPEAIQEKASTIFGEIKSAGKEIGDIFEKDGNIFAKVLDATGAVIDTIEIAVGEIAGGWYTPSDAGWVLGDILEILGEEFKYDGAASEDTATETETGGDSGGGDSSADDDAGNSGGSSTGTPFTSDGSGDGSSVPGGDETETTTDETTTGETTTETTTEETTTEETGGGGGGGSANRGGYMGGLSYQLQAPRSVLYEARDPMAQLDDIINRSLFKGMI